MHSGSLVDWLTLVVSAVNTVLLVVNACFVWQYVQETTKIRVVNEAQLEGQIRPAIVVLAELTESLVFLNLGKGPALHVRVSSTTRGADGTRDLDPLINDIGYIEVRGEHRTHVQTVGAGGLNGKSLQCPYVSLSGHTYWTVVDFDPADNRLLIATRFYPETLG